MGVPRDTMDRMDTMAPKNDRGGGLVTTIRDERNEKTPDADQGPRWSPTGRSWWCVCGASIVADWPCCPRDGTARPSGADRPLPEMVPAVLGPPVFEPRALSL
jgi:hypothetical protein